jgi:small subunit ribosomal protein S2
MSERTNRTIDMKALAQAGVIFGHKASRWNPKMAPFIWGQKNGVHLIDVSKTAHQIRKAAEFLESVAAKGETILWVGTKKAAQKAIEEVGQRLHNSYVKHRWIGGTLTNFSQVKKSVTRLLHYEDVLAKADKFHYTKKELVTFRKIAARLHNNVGAIKDLTYPIGAIVLVDVRKEDTALREALSEGIKVVGLADTNTDPSNLDYVIPTNDDAPEAIRVVLNYLADAVEDGQKVHEEQKKQKKAAKQVVKETDGTVETSKEAAAPKVVKKTAAPAKKKEEAQGAAPEAPVTSQE